MYFRSHSIFCTNCDSPVKLCMWRWSRAFNIPSFVQLWWKTETMSASEQSLILFLTSRNLAQKWWTVSWGCCRTYIRSYISGGPELLGEYRLWWVGGLNFGSCPTSVFGSRTVSKVTSSGPVKSKGSGNPTPKPDSGGSKVLSEGEVSGSGDSMARIY